MSTPSHPEISVVIPTKDRRDSLLRVLPSYLAQPEVAEIVIVINASTDGTQEALASLAADEPKLRIFDNGVNRGLPFSQNRGIAEARYGLIFIGEDDIELSPGFFATLESHRQALGVEFICGRNVWRFDGESAEDAIARADALPGPYVNTKTLEIATGYALPDDSVEVMLAAPTLGPASAFRKVPYDELYLVNFYREETDFQITAQERGMTLGACPHAVCFNEIFVRDRSGVHSSDGLRGSVWTARNNWRFLVKHSAFIDEHFDLGNRYLYFFRVWGVTFWREQALPELVLLRRQLREFVSAHRK